MCTSIGFISFAATQFLFGPGCWAKTSLRFLTLIDFHRISSIFMYTVRSCQQTLVYVLFTKKLDFSFDLFR